MPGRRLNQALARVPATLGLAILIGASGLLGPATVIAKGQPSSGPGGLLAWVDLGSTLASPLRSVLTTLGEPQINTGSDGRLTVLLLGSDTRGGGIQRTDTIMVMSIKNGQISAASIPRDTARIPNPYAPGTTFAGKVNGIVKHLRRSVSSDQAALQQFEYVIEKLLNIEIDYYALIKFDGFNDLVEQVEPVTINTQQIKDNKFWDDPDLPKGLYVPAMTNYQLYAWQPSYLASNGLCNGLWISKGTSLSQYWCHRALDYVRSRKGPGNSDFVRASRQQNFVIATINAVASSELSGIVGTANAKVGERSLVTDIPVDLSTASDMYNLLKSGVVSAQVVFKPPTYSKHIRGTTAYQLNLPAVRAWAAAHLK
jgi:anionic cell wall polymer biosynthesis LytR-Cps2A-Psr (LCP) family protein